jgi:signal transduction histidine kinase
VLTGVWRDQSLAHVPEVALALRGTASTTLRHNASYQARTVLEIFSRAAAIRLHHARPITVNGQVVGVVLASRSPRALMRGMYEDRGKIALGVLLIFATLIGLTAVLVRTIVRPIEALSAASRALANGTPVKPNGSRLQVVEIATLFDDFDTMATSIERRSAYLKDFAAAVSHEFKTPLAAINGAIELLSDHGNTMSDAQRQQFLDNMGADTERLSKLVRRLLDLARADLQAIDPSARADVRAICQTLQAAHNGVPLTLAFTPSEGTISAQVDSTVLESVLMALVDNAVQSGATEIALSVHRAANIKISVANNGPSIAAADQLRIFEPFFTSKRASGGTGMGLSIARSLLTPYGGSLTLATPPAGSQVCFDVTVPAALIG